MFHALNVITYLAFVGDYFARLHLSLDRRGFLRHSGLDVLVLVPPALQPLRTMQLIALLRLLDKRLGRTLRGRIVAYLGFATLTVLLFGALAVLDAERKAPGANIHTFGDALWWATTTITTVGYGEHHPVTPSGRVVAACLMFSGIALLSVVTGSVASWILDRVREETARSPPTTACATRSKHSPMDPSPARRRRGTTGPDGVAPGRSARERRHPLSGHCETARPDTRRVAPTG